MSFSFFHLFFLSGVFWRVSSELSSSPSVYYFVMSKLIFNPQIKFLNFNGYIFFISMSSIWVFFNLFGLSNILSFDYVFIPSVISLSLFNLLSASNITKPWSAGPASTCFFQPCLCWPASLCFYCEHMLKVDAFFFVV